MKNENEITGKVSGSTVNGSAIPTKRTVVPVYYAGLPPEAMENLESREKLVSPLVKLDVATMKSYAKSYCDRVKRLETFGTNVIDVATEDLILFLDRSILEALLSQADVEGLMAIMAIEPKGDGKPKNQTFILVPHDKNGKALKIDGAVQGEEQWPPDSTISMGDLLQNNIPDNINTYFNFRNIK